MISATAYAHIHDGKISAELTTDVFNSDKSTPWPPGMLSDHSPVIETVRIDSMSVRVCTYNCLNKKYIHHMTKVASDNQLLSAHPMVTMDQTQRELDTSVFVVLMLHMNTVDIMCLQEVSYELLGELKRTAPSTHLFHVDRANDAPDETREFTNCNVMIYNTSMYELTDSSIFKRSESNTSTCKQHTHAVKLKSKRTDAQFYVINMHRQWNSTDNFVRMLHEAVPLYSGCAIFAGDFNCSVRLPIIDPTNHVITLFHDTGFLFPVPSQDTLSITHVTHLCNAGMDKTKMLDRFDHVCVYKKIN